MSVTTESVRADYVGIAENVVGPGGPSLDELRAEYGAEFDAWLAEVKAAAWDEGWDRGNDYAMRTPTRGVDARESNPYRLRGSDQ